MASCSYLVDMNFELLQGPALPAQILLYLAKTGVPRTLSFSFLIVKISFRRRKVRGLQELELIEINT